MPNKNAKVIIPLAVGIWLLSISFLETGMPQAVETAFLVVLTLGMAVGIPLVVLYLMLETGWGALAKRYRATEPFDGTWKLCATGQLAMVSVDHPEYRRNKMHFASTLRVGTAPAALYLSTLFSRLPVLKLFFPTLRIPWSAVSKATPYEAPGWVRANQDTGALLQTTYDPSYTGTFVELAVGEPPVFLQLPTDALGDELSGLLLASAPNPSTGYA
ncbi:MAG: hypothetical protein HY329_20390 [Chloroflexi bacterium]|nr:hypothetical protein [Chloroflexota bacterium]